MDIVKERHKCEINHAKEIIPLLYADLFGLRYIHPKIKTFTISHVLVKIGFSLSHKLCIIFSGRLISLHDLVTKKQIH